MAGGLGICHALLSVVLHVFYTSIETTAFFRDHEDH